MSKLDKCPRCSRYRKLDALSRFGEYYVCSQCGNEEALEVLVNSGAMSREQYKKECDKIAKLYENT